MICFSHTSARRLYPLPSVCLITPSLINYLHAYYYNCDCPHYSADIAIFTYSEVNNYIIVIVVDIVLFCTLLHSLFVAVFLVRMLRYNDVIVW